MPSKILFTVMFSLFFEVAAFAQILVHETKGNSDVFVEKIGDSACTLNYKNGNYLTTEGTPVFYTFQVEIHEGELQSGMHSWLPNGINAQQPFTLSFYDDPSKKIYEYTGHSSDYGDFFYNTDLFERFLNARSIVVQQGSRTQKMPRYLVAELPYQVQKKFQQCTSSLNKVLQEYCASSTLASKRCLANKNNHKKMFSGLKIKDDPKVLAAKMLALQQAKATMQAKLVEEQQAKVAMQAKLLEEQHAKERVGEAQEQFIIKEQNIIAKKKIAQAYIISQASALSTVTQSHKTTVLPIFTGKLQAPFRLKTYVSFSGKVVNSMKYDDQKGLVNDIRFNTSKGVFYYESAHSEDYSAYDFLEFDLKVRKDPRDSGGFMIKMDCGPTCTSGNYTINPPYLGEWTHYRINIETLITQPGSTLDITNVTVPFAILPDWGNQRGVVFMVTNVQLSH